ncbi:free methionine-R-sulfoxide reductase [Diutina catenulata]
MVHADYSNIEASSKPEALESVVMSYQALAGDTRYYVANLANAASLVWHAYHSLGVAVNWAGFYVTIEDTLLLGPFQGKVACQQIAFGQGVCGTAAESQHTQLVRDVHSFPGHIACDSETNSEIVVPIVVAGKTVAVLDIDCETKSGFDEEDQRWLEQLAADIAKTCAWP